MSFPLAGERVDAWPRQTRLLGLGAATSRGRVPHRPAGLREDQGFHANVQEECLSVLSMDRHHDMAFAPLLMLVPVESAPLLD